MKDVPRRDVGDYSMCFVKGAAKIVTTQFWITAKHHDNTVGKRMSSHRKDFSTMVQVI